MSFRMSQKLIALAAWTFVTILASATLPHVVCAYPKRIYFVFSVVFLSAIVLEYLQTLTPDRHGTMIDAFEKTVGGTLGIFTARAIRWYARRSGTGSMINPQPRRERG